MIGNQGEIFLDLVKINNKKEVKKLIQKNGFLTYYSDILGQNSLHWCAKRNYINLTKIIIQKMPIIDLKDKDHRTALFIAAQHNNFEIVKVQLIKLLLLSKANKNIKNKAGLLPFDITNSESCKILLRPCSKGL